MRPSCFCRAIESRRESKPLSCSMEAWDCMRSKANARTHTLSSPQQIKEEGGSFAQPRRSCSCCCTNAFESSPRVISGSTRLRVGPAPASRALLWACELIVKRKKNSQRSSLISIAKYYNYMRSKPWVIRASSWRFLEQIIQVIIPEMINTRN